MQANSLDNFTDIDFTPNHSAIIRLSYSVDSSWITHSYAAVFLAFCYTRGAVDDDLKILALSGANRATTYPTRPRKKSVLFKLISLASEIFCCVCTYQSFAHPALEQQALLKDIFTTIMGEGIVASPSEPLPSDDLNASLETFLGAVGNASDLPWSTLT